MRLTFHLENSQNEALHSEKAEYEKDENAP